MKENLPEVIINENGIFFKDSNGLYYNMNDSFVITNNNGDLEMDFHRRYSYEEIK